MSATSTDCGCCHAACPGEGLHDRAASAPPPPPPCMVGVLQAHGSRAVLKCGLVLRNTGGGARRAGRSGGGLARRGRRCTQRPLATHGSATLHRATLTGPACCAAPPQPSCSHSEQATVLISTLSVLASPFPAFAAHPDRAAPTSARWLTTRNGECRARSGTRWQPRCAAERR